MRDANLNEAWTTFGVTQFPVKWRHSHSCVELAEKECAIGSIGFSVVKEGGAMASVGVVRRDRHLSQLGFAGSSRHRNDAGDQGVVGIEQAEMNLIGFVFKVFIEKTHSQWFPENRMPQKTFRVII